MAKLSTVAYALPVEEMRGKLATKQQDIAYAGQSADETPYDLSEGKKEAINFQKYVVLTKTRGKNRFYVKSRAAVNNTTAQLAAKAALGAAASLALLIADKALENTSGGLSVDRIVAANDYYNKQNGTNLTLREFIAKGIIPQLRNRAVDLRLLDIPQGDLVQYINLGVNTFRSPASYSSTGTSAYEAETFPSNDSERKVYRKFMNMLTMHGDGVLLKCRTAVSADGGYTLGTQDFFVKTGATEEGVTSVTYGQLVQSAIGAAQHGAVDGANVTISLYDKRGNLVATGTLCKPNGEGELIAVSSGGNIDPTGIFYVLTEEA